MVMTRRRVPQTVPFASPVDRAAAEVEGAALDKHSGEEPKGYQMLLKMGWKKDRGLGKKGEGIVAPINAHASANHGVGLGKGLAADEWPALCRRWLITRGILTQ